MRSGDQGALGGGAAHMPLLSLGASERPLQSVTQKLSTHGLYTFFMYIKCQ